MKSIISAILMLILTHFTFAQNFGIGVSNPHERLHVDGNIEASSSFIGIGGHGSRYMHLSHSNYKGAGEYALLQDGTSGHTFLNSVGSGEIYFRNDNNTLMTLSDNGNLGIGTSNPSYMLDVNGTLRTNTLRFPDGSVQTTAAKLINSYYAMTPATRQTIYGPTPVAINGLSITLTPASSNSKFLIMAQINGTIYYVCSSLLYRNGSKVQTHGGNSNEPGSQVTTYGNGNNGYMNQHVINYMDVPNTTLPITYSIRHTSGWGGHCCYTTYVNDRSSNDMRTRSTLTILEFAE